MRPVTALAALFAVSLTAFDAAAQSATQFDLVCSGTRQMGLDAQPVPLDYRLRVDLEARRWCWNDCDRTMQIVDVAPDRLVLQTESIDTPRKRSTSDNTVSRTTGEHRSIWIETRPIPTYVETKGQCDPAAFSGFPAARF